MFSLKNNKISRLFNHLLGQGTSPEKLALCLALGIMLGVFPIFGTTTVLCVLAALLFRLNQVAIQVVNYVVYPLSFILFIPFIKMGELLIGSSHIPIMDPKAMFLQFQTEGWGAFQSLGGLFFRALLAWLLISPVLVVLLYLGFLPLMKRIKEGVLQKGSPSR